MTFFWTQMYHNLPLHIGLAFSLAQGNKMAWIRDYLRLLRPAFLRKDFGKIIGRGRGVEVELPLAHIPPFHRRKYFFCQGEGDSRDWRLPSIPLHRQPRHPQKWEYRLLTLAWGVCSTRSFKWARFLSLGKEQVGSKPNYPNSSLSLVRKRAGFEIWWTRTPWNIGVECKTLLFLFVS